MLKKADEFKFDIEEKAQTVDEAEMFHEVDDNAAVVNNIETMNNCTDGAAGVPEGTV